MIGAASRQVISHMLSGKLDIVSEFLNIYIFMKNGINVILV